MTLTSRERRVLLLGGLAIVSAVMARTLIPAWRDSWIDLTSRLSAERRALAAERDLLRVERSISDSLVRRRQRLLALAPQVIPESDPAIAVARLAGGVSAAAAAAGLAVSALDHRPDTSLTEALVGHPRVRAEARGDVSGLMQFLLLIEQGSPMMRIRSLSVVQSDPRGAPQRPEELRIEVVIEGVALGSSFGAAAGTR